MQCRELLYVKNTSNLNGNRAGHGPKRWKITLLCWTRPKEYGYMKEKGGCGYSKQKWLHILKQFLAPAVIIILSIAFQCAGAPIQMFLWRSIKNNFAHRQAQEGPDPATGRQAQVPAYATALPHPTLMVWTTLSPWEHSKIIKPVEVGSKSVCVHTHKHVRTSS